MSITSPFRACIVAALAALTMLLAIPLSAHASQDIFLKFGAQPNLPDVRGETMDKSMPGAISVQSVDWEIENPVTIGSASGGAGTGKAKLNPLKIKKLVDASSPGLMMDAGNGAMIRDAWLAVRKAGSTGSDAFLQYHLKNVFVTGIETSAEAGDDGVYETVTLMYGSMQQRYVPAQPRSTTGLTPVVTGWDQITNQSITDAWAPIS
jgi:type VI secretion system secreted protein Hcp